MIAPHEEVVLDIGTGDGRFVSTHARLNPNNFYIGIDANVKPLEKPSMRATRKPSKGGLPNAMFVQAAVEDLPEELNGIANKIHINFPWGSLLRAVATGDEAVLRSLRRIAISGSVLEIVVGIDPERDRSEIERLGISELTPAGFSSDLVPKYRDLGFQLIDQDKLDTKAWSGLETTWARRLSGRESRQVFYFVFEVA